MCMWTYRPIAIAFSLAARHSLSLSLSLSLSQFFMLLFFLSLSLPIDDNNNNDEKIIIIIYNHLLEFQGFGCLHLPPPPHPPLLSSTPLPLGRPSIIIIHHLPPAGSCPTSPLPHQHHPSTTLAWFRKLADLGEGPAAGTLL